MDSGVAEAKWHSVTKGKVSMFLLMDSRVKAAIGII